ncbi:MAG: 5-formyltetrahydrofolate cyclo-ligase [Deltaproteobacteria bacterium]|nr:5-formyltetrahydrofolate cyclo-ligase [Deltaproteobacteria bacterium]
MLDEDKKKIRKDILTVRNALPRTEREAMSRIICSNFTNLSPLSDCASVMIFLSFGSEINTDYIIEWLWKQKKRVLVPLCKPETRGMDIFSIANFADLETGYFGIREPKRGLRPLVAREVIDLVAVPAVAFDRRGYRVGYGGGYYDRFLAGMDVPTIGLAFDCQIITTAPVEKYDLAVQGIITEKEYINVGL